MSIPPDAGSLNSPPSSQQEPPGPQPAMHYEFSNPQDDVIRSLSRKMKFVGVFYVLASGLMGVAGLIALFLSPVAGVFYLILLIPELLIGIWTLHAANSFQMVVETRGHDIPHLMNALTALRKLYTVMFWLLIAGLALLLLAIAIGMFLWSSGMIPGGGGHPTLTVYLT